MAEPAALLKLENVGKRFPGVEALDAVDFELAPGEVHALLGENGAGKSTLIKIMTGAHAPDRGRILLAGTRVRPATPAEAQRLGISAVYQEVSLLPNLSVAQNLFLGREPRRLGCVHWRRVRADSERLLERFGLQIDVTRDLSSYSIAVQQLVAIARGVDCSASVLVLDEPTASLDASEVETLFHILEELKESGLGIVFVTHFIDQVYALSDRITVLRNGRRVGTWNTEGLPRADLIAQMLGRTLQSVEQEARERPPAAHRGPVLVATQLCAANGLDSVSFAAGAGEALGLAGLLGSGRTELCEALFGLVRLSGGSLTVTHGESHIDSPRAAMRSGLALCPEDRRAAGIVGDLGVRDNIMLALQAQRGWWRRIPADEQQRLTRAAVSDLGIVCADIESAVATLSGGNQQKVILARWLCLRPRVLLLDEPTRGIDIGAHAEIIRLVRRLGDEGITVIIASSEIDELIALCDRVIVMQDLKAVAELAGDEISETAIIAAVAESR